MPSTIEELRTIFHPVFQWMRAEGSVEYDRRLRGMLEQGYLWAIPCLRSPVPEIWEHRTSLVTAPYNLVIKPTLPFWQKRLVMILSAPLSVAHCSLLIVLSVGWPHPNTQHFPSQNFLWPCVLSPAWGTLLTWWPQIESLPLTSCIGFLLLPN